MINYKKLEYLDTIARTGSISRAAEELWISQSALSQYLIAIEKELGIELFNRNKYPLSLTYAGEKYMENCFKIRQLYENTKRELNEIAGQQRGRLSLGIALLTSGYLAHQIVPRFKKQFPKYEIELVERKTSDLLEMVSNGMLDLAVVYSKEKQNLTYQIIREETIYLIAPPSYYTERIYQFGINREPLDITELTEYTFILLRRGHGLRRVANLLFEQMHFEPTHIFETENIETARKLAKHDLGFAIIPSLLLPSGTQSCADEVYYHISGFHYKRPLFLCYRSDRMLDLATHGLIDIIMESGTKPGTC